MTDKKELDGTGAARLLATWQALHSGCLVVGQEVQRLANELKAAPLTRLGLVDVSGLSDEARDFGRTAGMGLDVMTLRAPAPSLSATPSMANIQPSLFDLFAKLFSALTGRAFELVANTQEIKERMTKRFEHEFDAAAKATNSAIDELACWRRLKFDPPVRALPTQI